MVVAAAQHFPVPPPPKLFQSEESIKAYAYEEEMSSTLSGEEKQTKERERKETGRKSCAQFFSLN